MTNESTALVNPIPENPAAVIEEIDLLAELGKATEEKIADTLTGGSGADTPAPPPDQGEHAADFAPETAETAAIASAVTKLAYPPDKMAGLIVDGLDTVLESAFPYLYERTLDKSDRVAMKMLVRKYRDAKGKAQMSLSGEDQRIMELMLDYEDYCDSLPLDDDERATLREPLKELLKDTNYQTTPGNALIIAALIIMLPRLAPLGKQFLTKI